MSEGAFWGMFGCPDTVMDLPCRLPELRTVGERETGLNTVLGRLGFTWSDLSHAPRAVAPALWAAIAGEGIQNRTSLREFVEAGRQLGLDDRYFYLLVQRLAWRSIFRPDESLTSQVAYDLLHAVIPEYSGTFLFACLGIADLQIESWITLEGRRSQVVDRILRAIGAQRGHPVDEDWLRASVHGRMLGGSEGDVLKNAASTVKQWLSEGLVADTKLAASVLDFLDALESQRQT
jgi:hypothetical protein